MKLLRLAAVITGADRRRHVVLASAATGDAHELMAPRGDHQRAGSRPLDHRLAVDSCAILALVFGLILPLRIQIPRRQQHRSRRIGRKVWRLETGWTVATLLIFFGLFVWGANLYLRLFKPPAGAMKSMSSASSGCGRSSIREDSARSTHCTSPSRGR